MKRHLIQIFTTSLLLLLLCAPNTMAAKGSSNNRAVESIVTPYTILHVRNAQSKGRPLIVAGSYDGVVVCYDYSGELQWECTPSGFFNSDLFCGDIDGDNRDEVLATNADGHLYCLDDDGTILWKFKKSDAPLASVCIIHKDGKPYIACGGYETYLYYLDAEGNEVDSVYSNSYSKESSWGTNAPKTAVHIANFLRPITLSTGEEILVMHGANHSMSTSGTLYLFEPLATEPYKSISPQKSCTLGSMAAINATKGSNAKVLMGTTAMHKYAGLWEIDIESDEQMSYHAAEDGKDRIDGFGYRVGQGFNLNDRGEDKTAYIFGRQMLIMEKSGATEVLSCRYSFYDAIKDPSDNLLILASSQSGGSCIHIIDTANKEWRRGYENLEPGGKLSEIIAGSQEVKQEIAKFQLPEWEDLNSRPKVYFLSDKGKNPFETKYVKNIHENYQSPIFLNNVWIGDALRPDTWQRDTMSNDFFRNRRDGRLKYQLTKEELMKRVKPQFAGDSKGLSMWGGHGNDPFYFSPEALREIYDCTGEDQKCVLLFPEVEARGPDVAWLMNELFYPMAEHARQHNGMLFIRSKNIFWLGNTYESHWDRLISGEFSDVFIPSMEETSDKVMELSLAGRLGIWCAGSTDSWGSRCARDNTSYNRLREHSHQMVPNHFLRNMVYQISYGAQYLDNFSVDQKYMSILWDMIAKGLLYVPKREEIISFNPVHLSMLHPTQHFLEEGNEVKWVAKYDAEEEVKPRVFSRMNGSWPAAPITEWDFSRYAAGTQERRLDFISSYNNGMVMITPPSDDTAPRGSLESHMHRIYQGKTQEFFTDGEDYFTDVSKSQRLAADEYYKTIEAAIVEGEKMLPLSVKGKVGWVAAESAPKHIRLTLVDGGYLNPTQKEAYVKFNTIQPVKITDLVTGESIDFEREGMEVTIPIGLFRLFDIEISEEL